MLNLAPESFKNEYFGCEFFLKILPLQVGEEVVVLEMYDEAGEGVALSWGVQVATVAAEDVSPVVALE